MKKSWIKFIGAEALTMGIITFASWLYTDQLTRILLIIVFAVLTLLWISSFAPIDTKQKEED